MEGNNAVAIGHLGVDECIEKIILCYCLEYFRWLHAGFDSRSYYLASHPIVVVDWQIQSSGPPFTRKIETKE